MKEKSLEFSEIRKKQIEQSLIQLNEFKIYSGECDFPFRITIVGITNIHRLLILDDKDHEEFKKF